MPLNESEVESLSISTDQSHVAIGAGIIGLGHLGVWNRLEQRWEFLSNNFTGACYVEFGEDDTASMPVNRVIENEVLDRKSPSFGTQRRSLHPRDGAIRQSTPKTTKSDTTMVTAKEFVTRPLLRTHSLLARPW